MRAVAADHADQSSSAARRRRRTSVKHSKKTEDDFPDVTAISSTESSSDESGGGSVGAGLDDDDDRLRVQADEGLPNRLVDFFCVIGVHQSTSAAFSRNTNRGRRKYHHTTHRDDEKAMRKNNNNTVTPHADRAQNDQDDDDDDEVLSQAALANNKLHPQVLDCFPKAQPDVPFPAQVPKFVFPSNSFQLMESTQQPDATHFTFTLTLGSGRRMYCSALTFYEKVQGVDEDEHHPSGSTYFYLPKCMVVLSHYPFFDLFSTFLQQVYGSFAVIRFASLPLERWIANFCCDIPLPPRGKAVIQWDGIPEVSGYYHKSSSSSNSNNNNSGRKAGRHHSYYIARPAPNQFPLVNFSYQPLFRTLSIANILVVWGCLLQEGKIVLCSRHSCILTPVAEALLSLLFPLEWQGMYIPLLPQEHVGLDVLEAPVPFLVGLPHGTESLSTVSSAASSSNSRSPGRRRRVIGAAGTSRCRRRSWHPPRGVVVVDLDRDIVHLGWDDTTGRPRKMPDLPDRESMNLKIQLEELVDHLYLVPSCGMKGRLTTGGYPIATNHNNHEDEMLDNSSREPYSQVSRVMGTNRPQTSGGRPSSRQRGKQPKQHSSSSFNSTGSSGSGSSSSSSSHDENSARNWILDRASRVFVRDDDADRMRHRANQSSVDDNAPSHSPNLQEEPITRRVSDLSSTSFLQSLQPTAADQDAKDNKPDFIKSLQRHSKVMQAHTDRILAFAGQRYSTRDSTQSESQGDENGNGEEKKKWIEIAATLGSLEDSDNYTSKQISKEQERNSLPIHRVRLAFFSFFIQMFARYRKFLMVDSATKNPRFDTKNFLNDLNLSDRNRRYMADVVKSQMFERFLHAAAETTGASISALPPNSSPRRRRKQQQQQIREERGAKLKPPIHPQVLLLDEYILTRKSRSPSINFGSNASHLQHHHRHRKLPTPFLSDTTSWKIRKVIVPSAPSTRGLLPVLYGKRRYHYDGQVFPALKQEELIASSELTKSSCAVLDFQESYMCTLWSSLPALDFYNCVSPSPYASCVDTFHWCTGSRDYCSTSSGNQT